MEVVILCGGLGTRLRGVVSALPKCLAPVGASATRAPEGPDSCTAPANSASRAPEGPDSCTGQPFLGWLLAWLERYPVSHVVFSVGYLKEQVKAFVEGRTWPFSYDFAEEESPLGTGGAIRYALQFCREEQVFVVNGDTFYPVDLSAMPFEAPVTLALKPMKDFDRYGTVETAGQAGCDASIMPGSPSVMPGVTGHLLPITAFREKRPCREGLINGGVYAIRRDQLDMSALPEKFSFEKEVLEPAASAGTLAGWVSDAWFIDIGIPEDYALAQWAVPAWFAVQAASKAVMAAEADTLFLDRDGVLNRHLPGDYVRRWEQFQWMPGILEALSQWAGKYRHIILVTNQRGVGKGLMTDEDLSRIHARMMTEVLEAGGRIDLILSCTALADDDPRRKPNPGMFREACALFPDIDPGRSVMLGDSPSDEAFARACGMGFIRLAV